MDTASDIITTPERSIEAPPTKKDML